MAGLADIHRVPESVPLAYFITLRTHGTWLHGDARGSVDRRHNVPGTAFAPADAGLNADALARMRQEPVVFDLRGRELIEKTVVALCVFRGWHLFAVNMRSNHLHVVVESKLTAERVFSDIKARTTRRLREEGIIGATVRPWTVHGSTPHLWTPEALMSAIDYVMNRQDGRGADPR